MPRPPRLILPGSPHHVVTRGNNKRRIFSTKSDYCWFLFDLERSLRDVDCRIHQLTLMVNHIHMIVTPGSEEALPSLMKACLQRFAQRRNQDRGATGKLFEQRYYCSVIMTEHHLAATTCYNDCNAYRSMLVPRPEHHEWSTIGLHLGQPDACEIPARLWTPSSWYLSLGNTGEERVRTYSRVLEAYAADVRRVPQPSPLAPTAWERRRPLQPSGKDAR